MTKFFHMYVLSLLIKFKQVLTYILSEHAISFQSKDVETQLKTIERRVFMLSYMYIRDCHSLFDQHVTKPKFLTQQTIFTFIFTAKRQSFGHFMQQPRFFVKSYNLSACKNTQNEMNFVCHLTKSSKSLKSFSENVITFISQ